MAGPNVNRLIVRKVSLLAVPSDGGLKDAVDLFAIPGRLVSLSRQATEWVDAAIAAVKAAPDNPYGDDDEAIAAEILRRIEAKK
jgi:hypothetical protein